MYVVERQVIHCTHIGNSELNYTLILTKTSDSNSKIILIEYLHVNILNTIGAGIQSCMGVVKSDHSGL